MANTLSFMHVRSLVGLARVCKRRIRHLRKVLLLEVKIEEEEKQNADKGDIKGTEKPLKNLLAAYNAEEKDRLVIEEDELTIIKGELTQALREETKINEVVDLMQKSGMKEDAAALKKTETDLNNLLVAIRGYMKKIISLEMDALNDNERIVKYQHIMSSNFLTGKSFQQAIEEIKEIKEFEKEDHELFNLFDKLNEAVIEARKEPKALERVKMYAHKINSLVEHEEETLKTLVRDIYELLHIIHIVYMHLLAMMTKGNHEGFYQIFIEGLGKEGYPKNILQEIDSEYQEVAKRIMLDSKHIFEMARWLGYEMQAGQAQA